MYPDRAILEVFRNGRWRPAAQLRPQDTAMGHPGPSQFEYGVDFAGLAGLSCRYPVDIVRTAGVDDDIIEYQLPAINAHVRQLQKLSESR